jgi:endonuclease/exonuclease/phosphatase (EEP) superfamily protein YafD
LETQLPKVFALNLNHRTRPLPVAPVLIDAISELGADILVFNEYVDQGAARDIKTMLAQAGYEHQAVSDSVEYSPGRWHNQILIASKDLIAEQSFPLNGPDEMGRTNTLTVKTVGISVTGIRVPAYTAASDWYQYWEWLNRNLDGDIVIGDFNADPGRLRKWDRVLETLIQSGGWYRTDAEGDWSYKGNNGSTSRVDHVLSRGDVIVSSARYVTDPFVPAHTDHAALLVDFQI